MDELERLRRAMPDVPGLRPETRTACKEALMEMIEEETGPAATVPPEEGFPRASVRSERWRRRWLSAAAVVAVLAVGVTAALQLTSDEVASAALRYGSGASANGAADPAEPMLLRYEGSVSQHGQESDGLWCFTIASMDEGELSLGGGVGGPTAPNDSEIEEFCSHPDAPPADARYDGLGEALGDGELSLFPGNFTSPVGIRLPEEKVSPGDSWEWQGPLAMGFALGDRGRMFWQCSSTLVSLVDDVAEVTSSCSLGEHTVNVMALDPSGLDEGEAIELTSDDAALSVTCTEEATTAEERIVLDLETGYVTEYDGSSNPGAMSCPEGTFPFPVLAEAAPEMPDVVTHSELVDVVPLSEAG